MTDSPATLRAAYRGARQTCDQAQRQHQADVQALELSRQKLATAQTDLDALAQQDAEAIARHARRLEQQTRDGKSGPIPQLVPSEKHLAAEIAARRTHAAATAMVENIETAERASAEALRVAEQAVEASRNAVIRARCNELTEELRALRAREMSLVATLMAVRDVAPRNFVQGPDTRAELDYPAPRPTPSTVGSLHLVATINDARGDRTLLDQGAQMWREFVAELEATPGVEPGQLAQEAA